MVELLVALALVSCRPAASRLLLRSERRLTLASYQRAVAMEIVDGEMEALAAGEWRAFPPGTHDYRVHAGAATNLPPGRFILTVQPDMVRLRWQPARQGPRRPRHPRGHPKMKTQPLHLGDTPPGQRGYLLIEALVYIAVVVTLLGVAYAAMYRCVDRSFALRRNADDITSALHAGERWRADVRAATSRVPRGEHRCRPASPPRRPGRRSTCISLPPMPSPAASARVPGRVSCPV